ncbi:CPBP family intramembrane glutamic endopeptidase [Turneriella parva]|uniref:Abortive infection protein n=1 Tax=Turneriella parva (strain ATCC BAA-1111 / DSM 21527 / NCTC 11395 / H) TaxID=869212 RepID=I4BA32_TURPD|nr:Abortive infection protein [Turneriella parva DSM 21527]
MVLFYSITAGVYEETIFRGIYTKLFETYFKRKWLFFLFGAFIFASVHWCNGPVNLIHTFCWGLAALIIYYYRRKLLSLMLMHAAYDEVTYGRLYQ